MVGLAIAFTDAQPRRRSLPVSAGLAFIVTEAKAYAANIGPAQDAFDAADEAWVKSNDPQRDAALGARRFELENIWTGHVDRFLSIAERALKLPATGRETLKANITAYAELLDPMVGEQDYDTPLERLPKESLLTIIEHLINQHGGVVCRSRCPGAQ